MKRIAVLAAFLFVAGAAISGYAEENPLRQMAMEKSLIKVYVKDIGNLSNNDAISADAFKKEIEQSFSERASVKFEVVPNASDSDVQISGNIKQCQYMTRGPFKPSIGIGTMMAEAAATATENYADMLVNISVTDTKTGKELWNNDVYDYERKIMTAEESYPIIFDKVARKFVGKAFGKKSARSPTETVVP
jgi:hypothetical protein